MQELRGPLSGLQVIEISTFVAAPLGGMTLAQLGADVLRLDPLGGAADTKRWPLTKDGASLYWAGLNKGKRSALIDMRSSQGRDVVNQLIAACPDRTAVVLTNAVGREWLSHDSIRAIKPDVITVHVEGRSDGTPAVDYTVNAEVGFPMVTGPAAMMNPINHVLPAWDIACGLYAALGVSAAARQRELTGDGASVRVALADVALAMAGNLGFLAESQINHVTRQRIGNYLYGGFARDFSCLDGRVMVVALTGRHWADLVAVTGLRQPIAALEQALGVNFSNEDDRFEYREALAGLFERWFAKLTVQDVTANLRGTTLLWAPYRTFAEAVAFLHTIEGANPMMSEIDQPGIGRHLAPGSPLLFADKHSDARPAPVLGNDTESVLSGRLGLSPDAIEDLVAAGVVSTGTPPRLVSTTSKSGPT